MAPNRSRQSRGLGDVMCCIWPTRLPINPVCRGGLRRRRCGSITAIVAEFASDPQGNDEVKAVSARTRHDRGGPGERRQAPWFKARTAYILAGVRPEEQTREILSIHRKYV